MTIYPAKGKCIAHYPTWINTELSVELCPSECVICICWRVSLFKNAFSSTPEVKLLSLFLFSLIVPPKLPFLQITMFLLCKYLTFLCLKIRVKPFWLITLYFAVKTKQRTQPKSLIEDALVRQVQKYLVYMISVID